MDRQLLSDAFDRYKFGFKTKTASVYKEPRGLSRRTIKSISKRKNEPKWMLEKRLQAYDIFKRKPLPIWGPDLSEINFENIHYYLQLQEKEKTNWNEVRPEIKNTFDKIGIIDDEKNYAGSGAQMESETVYHSLKEHLKKKGVIFMSTDQALQAHPEIVKKYFSTVVPTNDNKFSALNTAVWSGGSFIYIPKNTEVDLPLQAYFRINEEHIGQFERTLIILDEGASANYIEGCSAPICSNYMLHAAVVEIVVKKGARFKYTTVQNWSTNVYNLVTKRAFAYEDAQMAWLDTNVGSLLNMKYPAIYLLGKNAKGLVESLAYAGDNQIQDTGAKIIHAAPNTSSKIISKSISKGSGVNNYRGIVKINSDAAHSLNHTQCDALLLDQNSVSNTYPTTESHNTSSTIAHEATVTNITNEMLFYLTSRGISEEQALSLIVNGFAGEVTNKLPVEYAIELNRLLEIQLTDTVG